MATSISSVQPYSAQSILAELDEIENLIISSENEDYAPQVQEQITGITLRIHTLAISRFSAPLDTQESEAAIGLCLKKCASIQDHLLNADQVEMGKAIYDAVHEFVNYPEKELSKEQMDRGFVECTTLFIRFQLINKSFKAEKYVDEARNMLSKRRTELLFADLDHKEQAPATTSSSSSSASSSSSSSSSSSTSGASYS